MVGVDWTDANLKGANLHNADLRDGIFKQVNLRGANLTSALLMRADFTEANLRRADFSGADLQHSRFMGANLRGADLSGADLRDALYDDETTWPRGFKPINHGCYPVKWLPDTLIKDSGLEEYVAGADDDDDD
jgi:hypothetical protein